MQVGQQNASIAAYNQTSVNVGNTGQQSANISTIGSSKPNDATTTSTAVQESTIVTISKEGQAQANKDVVMNIGNGTGKPPLDP
jgi:hypothetical protein